MHTTSHSKLCVAEFESKFNHIYHIYITFFVVTGDSGVFEAASPAKQPTPKPSKQSSSAAGSALSPLRTNQNQALSGVSDTLEALSIGGGGVSSCITAQILIRLKYSTPDSLLYVGVEKARNLGALTMSQISAKINRKM